MLPFVVLAGITSPLWLQRLAAKMSGGDHTEVRPISVISEPAAMEADERSLENLRLMAENPNLSKAARRLWENHYASVKRNIRWRTITQYAGGSERRAVV